MSARRRRQQRRRRRQLQAPGAERTPPHPAPPHPAPPRPAPPSPAPALPPPRPRPHSAETILNLQSLIEQEGVDFDHVNTAHALHRLAKLWRSYSSIHAHTQESAYQELVLPALQLLSRHMDSHMGYFEPWDVAISIWAYGHLGYQDAVVLPRLLQRAGELSPLFKPADCTQALIGLARLGLREGLLLKELSYVLLNQLEDVRAQDLSQVRPAARPPGPPGPPGPLLCAAGRALRCSAGRAQRRARLWRTRPCAPHPAAHPTTRARRRSSTATAACTTTRASCSWTRWWTWRCAASASSSRWSWSTCCTALRSWATATRAWCCRCAAAAALAALHPVRAALAVLHPARPREPRLAPDARRRPPPPQVSKHLHARRRSLAPQDVSMLLWSLAALKTKYNFILDELPYAIIPNLRQYKPAELSAVVYSYMCFRHYHKPLFAAVEAAYRGQLAAFSTQELVTLMRAFALFSSPMAGGSGGSRGSRQRGGPLFGRALEDEEDEEDEEPSEPQRQQVASPEFQEELAAALQERAQAMDPQAIALTAKAVTHWGLQHEGLQGALSAAAVQGAADFSLLELAHMMWAVSKWGAVDQPLVAALLRQAHWIMRHKRIGSVRTAKHLLDSIVSSCQRMGFVPWALIDDAESMSIYLRSPNQELLSTWGSGSMLSYSMDSSDEEDRLVGGGIGRGQASGAGAGEDASSNGAAGSSNGAAGSNGAGPSGVHAAPAAEARPAAAAAAARAASSSRAAQGHTLAPGPRGAAPQGANGANGASFRIHGMNGSGSTLDIRLQDGISIVDARAEGSASSSLPAS